MEAQSWHKLVTQNPIPTPPENTNSFHLSVAIFGSIAVKKTKCKTAAKPEKREQDFKTKLEPRVNSDSPHNDFSRRDGTFTDTQTRARAHTHFCTPHNLLLMALKC